MLRILVLLLSFKSLANEPSLPMGLGGDNEEPSFTLETDEKEKSVDEEDTLSFSGFLDLRSGVRLEKSSLNKRLSMDEARLHGEVEKQFSITTLRGSADLKFDAAEDEKFKSNLNNGQGTIDLRELNASFSPTSNTDLKVGRQILTWGTGDLIFINDLFPKDWKSFLLGRDLTYLKAPSDAVKGSLYTPLVNINLVYTPEFDSDRHIDGQRLSYYSPLNQGLVGDKTKYSKSIEDGDEIAIRLEKKVGSKELALYGYKGYWKSPSGVNTLGRFYHPELEVYGASFRAPLFSGVFNFEYGKYLSKEDEKGTSSSIPNSEDRLLFGFEREIAKNTTGSFQYYLESMNDYDAYKANNPGKNKDKNRHMITLKVRKEMLRQTLSMTSMLFYSPSDEDGHLRLNLDYKYNDDTKLFVGVHGFFGKEKDTFWGQFEENSSLMAGVTFNF